MRTGEIWTLQDSSYASKPRPVVIIQSEHLDDYDSLIVGLFTSHKQEVENRISVEPTKDNGLEKVSHIMTDKIETVPKDFLGKRIP
jgi:mRNA interferase MazF